MSIDIRIRYPCLSLNFCVVSVVSFHFFDAIVFVILLYTALRSFDYSGTLVALVESPYLAVYVLLSCLCCALLGFKMELLFKHY